MAKQVEVGYDPLRLHSIRIRWSFPLPWDEASFKEKRAEKECGWYYVTRVWGNTETAIYIGKARGRIYKRVLQHSIDDSESPFLLKRGELFVRFGTVDNTHRNTIAKLARCYHTDRFLKTVESALIQDARPLCNISQTNKYTRWYKLRIYNLGINHNLLSRIVDNSNDENVYDNPSWWEGQLEDNG